MTGEDVKALREALGLTQRAFAALAYVSASTVNRWESGKSKPSRLAVNRLTELAWTEENFTRK